jgi:pimeloyl-ACP methyl ester carboxylesterase/DNA-binding CsgD family transcriptional regulator
VEPEDQVIRHADVGGTSVAWSSIGSGPPLVIGGWWSSHLELDWQEPAFRSFVGRLAEHRSVIRYDRPGSGASDRRAALPADVEQEYAVLAGVLDATGLESLALLGASSGCAVASAFAARQPERTESLILYGGYVRGTDIAPPAAREAMLSVVEQHWGLGSRVLADVFLPGSDDQERERFAVFQRRSASRDVAAASLRSAYSFDSSGHLADVHVPTLVLHRRDDRAIPFALGRELADQIDGATFVALDGVDHFPWRGEADAVADEILRFLGHDVPERDVAVAAPTSDVRLSEREREILSLVARGHTDARIAEDLVLSTHTVHRHVANIRTKLGVPTRAAAAAWAKDHRII